MTIYNPYVIINNHTMTSNHDQGNTSDHGWRTTEIRSQSLLNTTRIWQTRIFPRKCLSGKGPGKEIFKNLTKVRKWVNNRLRTIPGRTPRLWTNQRLIFSPVQRIHQIPVQRTLMITLVETLNVKTGSKNQNFALWPGVIPPQLTNLCTTPKYTIILDKYTIILENIL